MSLAPLQEAIETLNDVSCALDVRKHVFSDREVFESIVPDTFSTSRPEALLVAEDDDGMALSLFMDASLLEEFADGNGGMCGGAGWHAATEGVSHFVCIAWNARHGRQVSQLDLELQADIDRYALCMLSEPCGDTVHRSEELRERLFTGYTLRDDLGPHERMRYTEASELADGVTGWLERHCLRDRPPAAASASLLAALRRFYRLRSERKIASARACKTHGRQPAPTP